MAEKKTKFMTRTRLCQTEENRDMWHLPHTCDNCNAWTGRKDGEDYLCHTGNCPDLGETQADKTWLYNQKRRTKVRSSLGSDFRRNGSLVGEKARFIIGMEVEGVFVRNSKNEMKIKLEDCDNRDFHLLSIDEILEVEKL